MTQGIFSGDSGRWWINFKYPFGPFHQLKLFYMLDKENNNNYELVIEEDKLIFRTSSFKAEKTSVLHGGVYTREFTSMLFASAVCMLTHIFILSIIYLAIIRYIILILMFALTYFLSNKYIFKKTCLEADFERSAKMVRITRSGIVLKKVENIPYDKISSIELGYRKFVPENEDGINFVQKISLQHGTAMPELSESEEFITLLLKLTDGSERTIYAGNVIEEPSIPINEINNFFMNKEN